MRLKETAKTNQSPELRIIPNRLISSKDWSLKLNELTLHPDYGSFFNKILNHPEKIGFLSIAFDCSGSFPRIKLNLVQCPEIQSLYGGESMTFYDGGVELFPRMKVTEYLRVGLIIFQQKKTDLNFSKLYSKIESKMESSDLYQEIVRQTESHNKPNWGRLERRTKRLLRQIEFDLKHNNYKHVTTFNLEYNTNEEWSFKGQERIEQDKVRISLVMNVY